MENHHAIHGKIHDKSPFSIAFCMFMGGYSVSLISQCVFHVSSESVSRLKVTISVLGAETAGGELGFDSNC